MIIRQIQLATRNNFNWILLNTLSTNAKLYRARKDKTSDCTDPPKDQPRRRPVPTLCDEIEKFRNRYKPKKMHRRVKKITEKSCDNPACPYRSKKNKKEFDCNHRKKYKY